MVRSVSMEPERTFLGMRNPLAHYIPLWILVVFVFFVAVVCTMGGYQDGLGKRQFPETKVNGDLEVTGSTSFGGRLATGPGQVGLDLLSLLDRPAAGTNEASGVAGTGDFSKLTVTAKNFEYIIAQTSGADAGNASLGSFDQFIRTPWGNSDETYRSAPLAIDNGNIGPAAFTNRKQGLNFYPMAAVVATNTARTITLPEAVDGQVIIIVLGGVSLTAGTAGNESSITIQTGEAAATAPAWDDRSMFINVIPDLGGAGYTFFKGAATHDRFTVTSATGDPNGNPPTGPIVLEGYIVCRPAGSTYQLLYLAGNAFGATDPAFGTFPP